MFPAGDIRGGLSKAPLIKTTFIGPREFGLVLIGIGLLALLLGTIEQQRDLKAMQKEYSDMPWSGTRLIAALIATLGLFAFVAAVYRF